MPHTGNGHSAGDRGLPQIALARAQGRGLVDRQAVRLRARAGRDGDPHVDFAHRHRRQSRPVRRLALSRAGDHGAVPHHDIRRGAPVPGGLRAGCEGDRRRGDVSTSSPITTRVPAEIARLRARHPAIVVYDCHSIRSAIPRLFAGDAAEFQHRHQQRRELPGGADRSGSRGCAMPERLLARDQRPLQRRLHDPPPRPPGARACTPCRWSSPAADTCASPPARSTPATGRAP